MKLIIEKRYLFDASVGAIAKHVVDHAHDHTADVFHHAPPSAQPTQILFIDSRVADWQELAAGAKKGVEVVIVNPDEDGLAQVTAALQGKTGITSISFITYGQPGQMELGSSIVNDASITSNAAQIASWGSHLAANADILLYGCNVGEGAAGQTFIQDLHGLTGAQVAASTDATGAAALGGNWVLEASTGTIDAHAPVTHAALEAYQGVLDAPLPNVSILSSTAQALLGSTFSETLAFSNTAATGVGYGPFIDVFVPHDAAQSATLTSATYLGSPVTITTVTLSTAIPGHVGVLGALHPLAVDNTGAAIFVQAPAGYVAGDNMYVLTLPFGSYTPGEPAADIVLNFSMANTTELSAPHGNNPLNITAIAGFEFGADPLNNPSTDPSIRGTGASVSLSDAADGAVTAGSQVTLINVSATTDLHEDETATGPDYPFHYVVTLNPALVTQSDPFTSFDFTFNLPNTVQYSGGAITLSGPSAAAGTPVFTANSGVGPFNNDGTVTVHFTSLTTNAADAPTTISIPVFVPQNDANGAAVLNATTGAPRTITETGPLPIYSYTGNWDAAAGSLDHTGVPQPFTGDSTANPLSTDFVAKSLAIQISDNASSVVPGQNITYTVNFEVSDFFDLNNLAIQTALSDGVTLLAPTDPGYATPTLSVTRGGVTTGGISFTDVPTPVSFTFTTPPTGLANETVAQSGSNGFWNYTRDDAGTGATTINFSVGALLMSTFGPGAVASVLQGSGGTGPTQGTITFLGRALAWYTNTFSDRALREGDTISETVTTTGTNADVVTVAGPIVTPTGSSVTDGSGATDTVPQGSLTLTIVAVNGVTVTGSPTIAPGDTVTYALTYTLAVGDYGNLNLDGFLPLPVFSAADPLANGGNVSTYAVDNADMYPIAGDYKLVQVPAGGAVGSVSVDGTANSVNFNLGTLNNPAAGPGTVQIFFTSTASNKPFVDGLFLALQGTDLYTNAASVTSNAAAITNLALNEPEVLTKTGIVGVVGDDGTTLKGTYTSDPTNNVNGVTWPTPQLTTPGTVFSASDSAGNPFTGAGNPFNTDNLNVTGADAGDTVRIVSTVFNQGHATAFDVTTSGALPAGYTMANVSHFQLVDASGNPVAFTGTEANYFSGAGIKVTPGLAANSAYFVVYDLTLTAAQATGQTGVLALTASSTIVNWADYVGGVAAGDGFVSGGAPVGESPNALADNATIGTNLPSIAKTAVAADDTTVAGSPAPVNLNSVVLGETVQYQLVITLPEGETLNGAADLKAQDILPAGMTFVSLDSIVYGGGVTHTGGGTAGTAGQTVTFDLGANVTNSNADANGTITILYTAQVNAANAPADLHAYTNNASLIYNGTAIPATNLTLTERDPLVAETLSVVDTLSGLPPSGGIVYSNENLTYTITLKNNGDAPANGVTDFVKIPAGLTYVASSLAIGTGGTGPSINDTAVATTGLEVQLNSLAPGATATFTFQATVNPSQPFGSVNTVQTPNDGTSGVYNSLPASVGVGHNYTDTAAVTVTTGQLTGVLSIVDQSNATGSPLPTQNNTQTTTQAVVGEVVRMHAYVQVPEGSNATTLDFTLPSGLQYLNDGSASIAFVSADGGLTSSQGSLSGLTAYQDTNNAGLNYVNPATGTTTAGDVATFAPLQALPGAIITTPGTHFDVNLGTLTDNAGSTTPNFVLIEFDALVTNVAANVNLTTLTTSFSANGGPNSNNTVVTVEEPHIAITKNVTAINQGTNTVTYAVKLTNTGDATAYNVTLDNPVVANEQNITFMSAVGPGTNIDTTTATDLHDVLTLLAVGASETITYTVQVVAAGTPVTNDIATATWASLPGSFNFHGSSGGANDSATGFRDFNAGSNPPDSYRSQVTADLGTATGQVWQDLGSTPTSYTPSTDTALNALTVTALLPGPDGIFGTGDDFTLTTTTAGAGNYSFGLLPDGLVRINLNAVGTAGGPGSTENLIFDPDRGALPTNPATAGITIVGGSAVTGVNYAFQLPDTPPTISTWSDGTPGIYVQGTSPIILSDTGAAAVADTQLDTLIAAADPGVTDYRNTVLTVERYTGVGGTPSANANDVFGGDGAGAVNLVLAGGTVKFNGTLLGTFTQAAGVLTITFGAGVQKADIGNVLDHLTYKDTGAALGGTVVMGSTLYDGNEFGAKNYQGSEPDVPKTLDNTSAAAFVSINLSPTYNPVSTFTEPNDSSAAAVAVSIAPALIADSATYTGATATISANFQAGGDVLTASTVGTSIVASYNAVTGVMTLSGADTAAHYQQVLRTLQFYDTDNPLSTAARTVTIVATKATGNDTLGTATVNVVADNQSPILAAGTPNASGTEDTAPVGPVGTLVSSLVGGLITDPDGPSTGIALTAAQTTFTLGASTITGNWFFSTNNGASWSPVTLSAGQGLDLLANANTRLYFQPTTGNYNGTLPNALTFQAWDGKNGVANGTVVTMPGSPGTGLSSTGAPQTDSSSYSTASDVANVIVAAVNDAPIATGTTNLGQIFSGDPNPPGATVATLFGPNFSDTADQQQTASNPTGSLANNFAGIAITANAATALQGSWEYSTNGGTTWNVMPAVSTASSVELPTTAELRFVPAAGFQGTPGALSVHLIDDSSGAVVAATGVNVTVNGGITPISAAVVPLTITVLPAPVLSIVGESNNTTLPPNTPTQTDTQVAADAVVGEIVRMHAYVEVPPGSNATTLNFTLPTGLQYLNDGTATIAFVSPDGLLASSNPALSALTPFQDANPVGANYVNPSTGTTTANDAATLSSTQFIPGSIVTVVGNTAAINLGTLTDGAAPTQPNYVIVEFNALVTNVATNQDAVPLSTTFKVNTDGASNATVVTVEEPGISVTKNVTAINGATGTVTYAVTLTNTGDATAYNVTLDNPVVANEQNITFVSATGAGANTDTTTAFDLHDVVNSLAVGTSETITYTVKVTTPSTPVVNDLATATFSSLPGSFTFAGSSGGASDGAAGFRDFNGGSNPPNDYTANANADLGTASGQVWQDLGSTPTVFTPTTDTPLPGLTVTATLPGPDGIFGTGDDIVLTTTTGVGGTYSFGLLPDGPVRISLNTNGSPGGPGATENLIFDPDQGGQPSNPAGAQITIAGGTPVNGADFSFQLPDTPPAISTWSDGAPGTYIQGTSPIVLSDTGTAAVADTQLDALIGVDPGVTDYRNTVLTVQRYTALGGTAAPNANDIFGGDGAGAVNLVLAGGNVTFNGTALGTFTEVGGVLTITFGAGVQKADIGNVLDHLTYQNTGAAFPGSVVVGSTLYDGNEAGGLNYQGSEPDVPKTLDNTSAPAFVTVTLLPASALNPTYTEPNDSSPAAVAVDVFPTLIANTGGYLSATVSITANFVAGGEDVLTANTAGTGITATYDNTTGVLTLTGADTTAHYQQVIRSVQYYDSSDTPSTAVRTVAVVGLQTTGPDPLGTSTVNVVADNDSPILAAGVPDATGVEDTAPVGPVGTLVSSLLTGLVTDPDGPGLGLAITAAKTSFTVGTQTITGTWFYSIDGGTTWTPIAIAAGQGLDLVADANTRVYFQPTTANYNGTLPGALTFQAWDATNGVANGTVVTMPASPGTGLSSSGAPAADSSSYSSASDIADVIVAAINDAPVAVGTASLGQVTSGDTNPHGSTVAQLFTPTFSDAADQQGSASNPGGSAANTLAGIAITGDAAIATQGVWQYSTDGGTTWIAVPTTVATNNALILSPTAELRFVAPSSFEGTPGALTVHVIDNSSGPVANAVGVDVTVNGGITPISSSTVPLDVTVEPPPPVLLSPPGTGAGRTPPEVIGGSPLIPEIWLTGSGETHFIITDQHSIIQVPPDIFQDTDPSQQLTYEAELAGGAPLPSWLNFDARSLVFTGTPPENAYGTYDIVITARDTVDNRAVAEFRIIVGREQGDLQSLMRTLWVTDSSVPGERHGHHHKAAHHVTHHHEAHHARAHGTHHKAVTHKHAVTGALDQKPDGHAGLSNQLLNTGRTGSFASAHALLKALTPFNTEEG